ncbi:MAG: DNA-3-methyladenine glycosylase [Thermoleophilia bacterium]
MPEIVMRPRLPYSLADSSAGSAGGTRRMRGGVLELWDRVDGEPVRLRLWQRAGGEVVVHVADGVDADRVHERARFLIAADVDPAPFLRIARRDPLARAAAWRWPGMRPMRLTSPAHAVLAAVCGQLVSGREAARRHRAVLRAVTGERDGLMLPPDQATLAAVSPAGCRAAGLPTGRAAAMIRACRGPALDRLADRPTARIVAAVTAVPGLGPWSAGIIAMRGFGRYEQGLVGDLGLMRLWAAVHGAWPAPEETASLLAPYGEWAGLASAYLLRHPLASLGGRPATQPTPRAAAASA